MNVAYDQFSTQDVAKIIGITPQTVAAWVRGGVMDATDVSDGTSKARYMFTDEEVTRVQGLIKTYGKQKWVYKAKKENKKAQKAQAVVPFESQPVEQKKPIVPFEDTLPQAKEKPIFDADKVMNKLLRVQELKERLEDIEAERNQVLKEIELLKEEIVEVI